MHPADGAAIIPASLFQSKASSTVDRLTALLPSLTLGKPPSANKTVGQNGQRKTGVHAFTILARMLKDTKFAPASLGLPVPEESSFARVNAAAGDALVQLTNEWVADLDGDGATAQAIANKIEELAWMNALIYGVGGWVGRERSATKKFNADFF